MDLPISDIKKTVCFFGEMLDGSFHPHATGFFVTIDGINHVVTAKHVIQNNDGSFIDENTVVAYNQKNGIVGGRKIKDLKSSDKVDWIIHDDPDVDLAILPIRLVGENDDVILIPEFMFLNSEEIFETEDVIHVSYQPGVFLLNKISPVIRGGIISRIIPESPFYIDGFAFPGNSGSPVFLKPKLNENGIITVNKTTRGAKLIGVISSSLNWNKDNTGLSMVFPINFLKEIINSEKFQTQLKNIKQNLVKPTK